MWISPKTDYTIYPEFFKIELTNPSESVKHFVTDERQSLSQFDKNMMLDFIQN